MKKWWKTKKATSVYKDEDTGMYVCVYHDTPVVKWDDNKIILNSGGFRTVTTKRRMNEVSKMYGLGFDVSQTNYKWWVTIPGALCAPTNWSVTQSAIPFEDGLTLLRL